MGADATERFVKVCQKLDELRFVGTTDWGLLGQNIFKNSRLASPTRLFLFWLCSIIDQFYRYVTIWTNGEKAMLELIEDSPQSFSDVEEKMKNVRKDRKGNTICDIFTNTGKFVLVRDDYERIKNTFEFLEHRGDQQKDFGVLFVKTLVELLSKCPGENGILKLAYFLDGWMFSGITISTNPSVAELRLLQEEPRKRLWMFIMLLRRDPAVLNLFRSALIEAYDENVGNNVFNTWNDENLFDPKGIELPGDMWNKRLFAALLSELPAFLEKSPREARSLARVLASQYAISPSIFDVTFELGANRCRSLNCEKCPFGDNKLCHKGKDKSCSVSDWLFPYYEKDSQGTKCNAKSCPIAEDAGRNLCSTREIDRDIEH